MPQSSLYKRASDVREVQSVEQQTPVAIENTDAIQIDPATEGTLATVARLADALASNGADTLLTESGAPVPLEDTAGTQVNPATEDTLATLATEGTLGTVATLADALASNGADTVQTEQQTPVGVEDTGGAQVDPATEGTLGTVATLADALGANGADVLQTEQQTPVGVEDTTGTQVDPATEGTLSSELTREIATWSAGTLPIEDTSGAQIDPATEGTLGAVADRLTSQPNIAFGRDTVATAGTAVPLNGGTSQPVANQMAVAVQSMPGNAGNIYLGDDTVDATTGYPLQPGQMATLAVDDVATLHIDADNDGSTASWLVEVA